jgi:hypothetical protein
MDPAIVERTILTPASSLKEALEMAEAGGRKTILAMPYGGSTLPKLKH